VAAVDVDAMGSALRMPFCEREGVLERNESVRGDSAINDVRPSSTGFDAVPRGLNSLGFSLGGEPSSSIGFSINFFRAESTPASRIILPLPDGAGVDGCELAEVGVDA